jgi:hypothetical protein
MPGFAAPGGKGGRYERASDATGQEGCSVPERKQLLRRVVLSRHQRQLRGHGARIGRHPMRGIRSHSRTGSLSAATTLFVGYTAVMLQLERRMRRSGGPGIIPFELAGNATRAEQIMSSWGHLGRRAARWSLWLDFGYMLTYGTLTAMLVDRARLQLRHPSALPLLVVPTVAADAVEGIALLHVLGGKNIAVNARRARTAAIVKFAVLSAAVGYSLIGIARTDRDKR